MCAETPNGRVSSQALEGDLNWSYEGRYATIRKRLIDQGKIRAFPGGAGGSLECVGAIVAPPKALRAFLSYSHADKLLKAELLKHLDPLRRSGLVQSWHDGEILVGKEWENEIWRHLRTADIILLLITIDFVNSEYCYDKELAAAVERHRTNRARVIPIIGRNCLWQELSFSHLQATLGGKAIMAQPDRDEALTQVAREVKKTAEELRELRVRAG